MIAYEGWGLALVHFVWQGFLVMAALFAALRALSGSRPAVRYAVSLIALAVMPALPFVTLWSLGTSVTRTAPLTGNNGAQPTGNGLHPLGERPSFPDRIDGPVPGLGAGPQGPSQGTVPGLPGRISTALEPLLGWIVGAWVLGVLVLSIRMLGGWVRLRKLTGFDGGDIPGAVRHTARKLATRLAVSRPVRLVRSMHVTVPSVVGWLRPVILLPASALTGLTSAQLEVIIAHELAHIRRHDYLVNLFQTLIETLLFYHPAVWWVSHRIREEREHCCDDLAVEVCGDRRLYAGALLELESLRAPPARLAVAADGTSLIARVRRLLGPGVLHTEGFPRRWPAALSVATVAIVFAFACGGESLVTEPPGMAEGGPPGEAARESGSSAKVFIGEAFADKVFRYEVTEGGGAVLDREITANVKQPGGIAFSPWGEMFVSNRSGSVARYLDPEGAATPNGLITAENTGAPFGQPHWLTFRDGELFLAQQSGTVLRFTFDQDGNAVFNGTLMAGKSSRGIQTNPRTGEILVSSIEENSAYRFRFDAAGKGSADGRITGGGINLGHGMTFTPWGELLIANYFGDSVSRFTFDAAGNAVPNGIIAGGAMKGPIDLDISPWGELFVTNHNQVPGVVTRWTFSTGDASAQAVYNGSFTVPGNLGGIQFASRS